MRAEAYRSMADERGQVSHLQAAVSQVLSTVNRDAERAFGAPWRLAWAGGGVNFPDRDF